MHVGVLKCLSKITFHEAKNKQRQTNKTNEPCSKSHTSINALLCGTNMMRRSHVVRCRVFQSLRCPWSAKNKQQNKKCYCFQTALLVVSQNTEGKGAIDQRVLKVNGGTFSVWTVFTEPVTCGTFQNSIQFKTHKPTSMYRSVRFGTWQCVFDKLVTVQQQITTCTVCALHYNPSNFFS